MSITNKNYLGVGLASLGIIVFWIFGMPAWDKISLLNEATAERESILSSRKDILARIEGLNSQYQQRSSEVSKISSVVPNTKGTAELVSTIETITQQTGLQLVEITMRESGNPQEELQSIFVELGLIGTYPSLTAFLDLMEKNLRLIDVLELNASKTSAPGQQIILNFRIKANTYYLNVK